MSLLTGVFALPTTSALHLSVAPAEEASSPVAYGRSFLTLLQRGSYEKRSHIHLEMTWHDRYEPVRGVRTEGYKYIRSFGARPLVYIPADIYDSPSGKAVRDEYYGSQRPGEELYDLDKDPLERKNVIDDPGYQWIAEQLRKKLEKSMKVTKDPLMNGPIPGREEPQADYWDVVQNNSPFEC